MVLALCTYHGAILDPAKIKAGPHAPRWEKKRAPRDRSCDTARLDTPSVLISMCRDKADIPSNSLGPAVDSGRQRVGKPSSTRTEKRRSWRSRPSRLCVMVESEFFLVSNMVGAVYTIQLQGPFWLNNRQRADKYNTANEKLKLSGTM
jgi:hypothetical protein